MLNKAYSKDEIIKMTRKYQDFEYELDKTTFGKRLNTIIKLLEQKQVKKVLDQEGFNDTGNYFFNHEMNITKASLGKTVYEGYNYNLIDAIFLAVLVSLYNHDFLKKVRNKSNFLKKEEDEQSWVESYTNNLQKFEQLWNERGDGREWGQISLNIESLLYRFTLLPVIDAYPKEVEQNLNKIIELFAPLSDQEKVEIYEKVMEKRVNRILSELECYIKNMKKKHPDRYTLYKMNQSFIETDKKYTT